MAALTAALLTAGLAYGGYKLYEGQQEAKEKQKSTIANQAKAQQELEAKLNAKNASADSDKTQAALAARLRQRQSAQASLGRSGTILTGQTGQQKTLLGV